MLTSRYVLARTTTVLATSSIRLASSSRKSRSKRRKSKQDSNNNSNGDTAATVDAAVDEVEQLLAATATHPSTTRETSKSNVGEATQIRKSVVAAAPTEGVTGGVSSDAPSPSSPPTKPPAALDAATVLHFKAVHQANDFASLDNTTTRNGPTQAMMEQIERRRSKLSLAEAEFDVGVTERLVPELPRLPALHEVHYGDAVVREVDRSQYFAQQQPQLESRTLARESNHPDVEGNDHSQANAEQHKPEKSKVSTVIMGSETYAELSLDNDLSEADFAAFDAEAATKGSPAVDKRSNSSNEARQLTEVRGKENASASENQDTTDFGCVVTRDQEDADTDRGEDAIALPLTFGTARPWFVPPSGVVQLEPLPPHDCALLLRFLLYLRQQTEVDLVPTLRRALHNAETEGEKAENGNSRSHPLTLADVVRYLDTAPPPVIAFTESLPSPTSSPAPSVTSTAPSGSSRFSMSSVTPSPAFVFHLYLENVSSQNAIGHLATLFGLPQRCFQTHSAVSKMSCTTVLCAVAENRLRREHLLLLNTLRHPGFVLRISTIQEVSPERYASQVSNNGAAGTVSVLPTPALATQQLFGELARWQPLYETELLLRRVRSGNSASGQNTRQQLEHRLRAVQTLGAICFCANREASLARAATDILHGFFKSALLNALQRRKSPTPMQRFLKRPNIATAQHAHHVSTDPTVRQVLKTFVQTNGDWHATVVRTPYVWRRRWINALRGLVWNAMASQRLRKGGRGVCLGDVVLRPEFRDDVHRRGIMTVKAEHVMVVRTPTEAAAASLTDVFIPFLRGRYPEHLFADQATQHPIMTRTNMLALLRSMHAPQLLLGLTDELRLLLDVRAESSPMLFRRLIVRPVAMEFAILEDKPPMKALHFDAARLLANDRWTAAAPKASSALTKSTSPSQSNTFSTLTDRTQFLPSSSTHLIPPSEVLERTTLGARLTSGVLAEDFFSVPSPEDYVVLGHAHRHLAGGLVSAAPHSNTADIGDRVYTVYVRAVVEHNFAGLSNMLREYFLLSGIETESDSALQHKVHRMRRELDPETPLLTAPVYCTTCFNRDHDTQEQCAEYQYKVSRRAAQKDVAAATASLPLADNTVTTSVPALEEAKDTRRAAERSETHALLTTITPENDAPSARTVYMRWLLRRRNDEQRWGVHLTKSLHLVGLENVQLIRKGAIWSVKGESDSKCTHKEGNTDREDVLSLPGVAQSSPWPVSWITEAASGEPQNSLHEPAVNARHQNSPSSSPSHGVVKFLQSVFQRQTDTNDDTSASLSSAESLHNLLVQSPVLFLPSNPAVLQLQPNENTTTTTGATPSSDTMVGSAVLKACQWTLSMVNTTTVASQRDVAAALLRHAAKTREVWLTFELKVDEDVPEPSHLAPLLSENEREQLTASAKDAWLCSTHTPDRIPQSTAALPPKQRHEAESAMRAAVQRTTPEAQRWLQDLPYRLTLVLLKRRRHLHKHRSWGLQLDGTDMTLVNFARLMLQYMCAPASSDKRRLVEYAMVDSLSPATSFPRDDNAITSRLLAEISPKLEPLLDDMYRVVRINNTAVHHKAEAASAMAAFQVSLDAKMAKNPTTVTAPTEEVPEQFFLTLTLERKGSSYRICAAPGITATGTASRFSRLPKGDCDYPQPQQSNGDSIGSEAATTTTASNTVQVDGELLDGLATPQCPVRPYTPAQLSRSSVTLAINRLMLTEQTRDKWGLRLQHGTRRLKAIQQNRQFSFHVFAAKQSQGTRIADTLRLVSTRRLSLQLPQQSGDATEDPTTEEKSAVTTTPVSATTHVITRSFYLYFVERVNQRNVRNHAELRAELLAAAQPLQLSPGSVPSPSSSSPVISISSLPPESVTLSVRQFPLLRFAATVRRGGVGEGSALAPVGLQVDKNMRILSIFAGSPMARALTEAVGPLCSARRLIKARDSINNNHNITVAAAAEPDSSLSSKWDAIALPHLRTLVTKVEALLLERSSTTKSGKQQQRRWAYNLDEDETAAAQQRSSSASTVNAQLSSNNSNISFARAVEGENEEVAATLRELADVAAHTLQQLSKCTMVDGVHVLQTSLLHEFALTQLTKLQANDKNGNTVIDHAELAALEAQLTEVYEQVRWEVVYAALSNRPLRTPADLAAAFAPGVAEETISVQQFVED